MDLGIRGKSAIVCASSRGLGKACAASLLGEGAHVVINGRSPEPLAQAERELKALGSGQVIPVLADIEQEEGRAKLFEACPQPDILVNNNAGPPPGLFLHWDEKHWLDALQSNLLAPLMMIRAALPGMQERKFGRIVNITSAMVKSPHRFLGLSTTARTGLTAMSKGISADAAQHNVTINNMLPERFDTDRQVQMAKLAAAMKGITPEQEREAIIDAIPAKRMGIPAEFGDACAFLCSAQAGFITGQNLQLDGGAYEGLI
ncbi:MAG: SDR family oxidoreductase [Pseudomonadota bacterium]